ncbi:acyl-CoA N-acyltransferase [Xylariales sp. PMI_506]|nr:acyl-CoA N-acyltransferase [Xylariales sp. PMI_506]
MTFSKRKRKAVAITNPIEEANSKSDEQFVQQNLQPSINWATWVHPRSQQQYSLSLVRAGNMNAKDLAMCFGLIEETSKEHYESSSRGWKPRGKMTEMKSNELRYILVKDYDGNICGFTSLMPTFEEGQPVIYCYEIHLKAEVQGTGLGKHLMGFQESVAAHTPDVNKVMLTCFLKNENALAFYRKLGFEKDSISPEPRKLRFGKEFIPDYIIMSKKTP